MQPTAHLRTSRAFLITAWTVSVVSLSSCADSHPAPQSCASDADCTEGGVCVGASDGEGLCFVECDYAVAQRCADGSWCRAAPTLSYCWPGGPTPEGEVELRRGDCAFGLAQTTDYTAEPLRLICGPVCNVSDDCRRGEMCDGRCMPPCTSSTCVAPNRCAFDRCVNERRFARSDCNADGTPDCHPAFVCDPEAIGGCEHPPEGEE